MIDTFIRISDSVCIYSSLLVQRSMENFNIYYNDKDRQRIKDGKSGENTIRV